MGQARHIFPSKWDEIPNSHFGFHFFDSFVRIVSPSESSSSSPVPCGQGRIEVRSRQIQASPFKEAPRSIDDWRSNPCLKWKRSLTEASLIERFAQLFSIPPIFVKSWENKRYSEKIYKINRFQDIRISYTVLYGLSYYNYWEKWSIAIGLDIFSLKRLNSSL